MDREKIIRIIDELIFDAQKKPNWKVENALRCLKKELLKEQEAKTGHWIDTTNTIGFPRCKCSECNSEAGAIWMKYCPNCGAKMEGR